MTTLHDQAMRQLNLTDGQLTADDYQLLDRLIDAAHSWLETQLGYKLGERYPPSGSPLLSTVPPALDHAILMMVSHWYANREASVIGVNAIPLPLGVSEIIQDYRDWSWGEADA